jgi:hypothetical protein
MWDRSRRFGGDDLIDLDADWPHEAAGIGALKKAVPGLWRSEKKPAYHAVADEG